VKKFSNKKNLYIIANAALGKGFSGSDRIFVELARKLKEQVDIKVCVWEEGFDMCQRQGLVGVIYENWFLGKLKNLPFHINYFYRILTGIYYSLKLQIRKEESEIVFYAASDFWQDFMPFIIFKLRFPKALFIGSYYLASPNPFIGYRKEYEKLIQLPKIRDIIFYLQHLIPKFLLPIVSDYILVTSDPDKKHFTNRGFPEKKLYSIMGGVNFENYKKLSSNITKKYDAIFYGRFHAQKGVLELIDIWKLVLKKAPSAKLIMIGNGPLFSEVENKIIENRLSNNIFLKGHMDDSDEKLKLFAESKIVVHPAVYDSGGMASAEIMYLEVPGVSFDLEALKTYYPKGMLKTKCFDLEEFSDNIYQLLSDKELYKKTATEAKECVVENFDWNKKANTIMNFIS
jgi:glycosyltransferase involved in cell wall biosynthesis